MSKLSFRARALDASKPMPIYMAEELPDLPDYSAINRAVPQMPSGMEKEEECEHHLQRAICAGLIIPTPEVSDIPQQEVYDKLYPANYKQPRQLIHMQPFTMEQDIPDYDMDSEDERWLDLQAKKLDLNPLKFEEMMDRLEKNSGQTVVSLQEAKALLKEDDDLIIAVFDYWLNKRLTLHPLLLAVKTEHRSGTAVNNPYLAFRRRTEKMQTRKNRKNDETSYEKMLKLRRDLTRAVTLLEFIKRREKMKREYLHLTVEVFEKRYTAKDFSGLVAAEVMNNNKSMRPAFTPILHNHITDGSWRNKAIHKDEVIQRKEKRQYKRRKHKPHNRIAGAVGPATMETMSAVSSDEEPVPTASPEPEVEEDEGQFAFRRNKLCTYHMPLPSEGNWPWCSKEENGQAQKRFRYALTSLSNRRCVGLARRRMGRGGRVILDRLAMDGTDDFWSTVDYTIYDSTKQHQQQQQQYKNERREVKSDCYSNLDVVNNVARTDIKSEQMEVRTCGDVSNSYLHADGNYLKRIKVEPAQQTVPANGLCNTQQQSVQMQEVNRIQNKDDEVFKALRQEWHHFRPKTPPPQWSPPSSLLPEDHFCFPSANVPFSLELKTLDETDVFTDSSFISAPYMLDYDISMEVPVTDTRQTSPSETTTTTTSATTTSLSSTSSSSSLLFPSVCESSVSNRGDAVDSGVVGCSKFSMYDVAGSAHLTKKHSYIASTLTSPKLNSVNVQPDVKSRTHNTHTISSSNADHFIGTANGITQLMDVGFRGGGIPYALKLRTSAHKVSINNSHSANILEIPMSTDADPVNAQEVSQCEPGSSSPTSKAKSIVRKNNLVMEVT
ncbi:PREDICTED: enhancer of polycomb homolog 1 isoform X2 [Nicrophorus vespilloides]|uniref:Enhancer of polycomb-like protein n=1 Tax=Nicrophorus vespilloides TaxID=110193 RepID=A0ABM1MPP0_NICVS|nr:PREDICTED: enhancer of polycomb homolog 1 isoform X2 [Nicrophorus vespilloides]